MYQLPGNIIDAGDVLIIGSGLAGLFTALKMQPRPVTVLSAGHRRHGAASSWAQGGIAAALGSHDDPEFHARDTENAGDGLVDPAIASILATEAADRINDLARLGVPFNRDADGAFALGQEAAHSHHRIVGVNGDRAGAAIMESLLAQVERNPAIRFLEGLAAYELAIEDDRVVGVFARSAESPKPLLVRARAVILATGGSGHLYQHTTNPVFANGEAIAMAARAGALINDVEFIQFHPTAFCGLGDPAPLATEALRGKGAWLVNGEGERFMPRYHPDAELAPRDIVARAVFRERHLTGQVGLDLRRDALTKLTQNFSQYFPTVAATCAKAGLNPATDILPVAPAAHYHMGGIWTDTHGRTSLPGLWACGEVASTGAHGANRLASNSLLEGLVFGARIAQDVNAVCPYYRAARPRPAELSLPGDRHSGQRQFMKLRALMSSCVGVERDGETLRQAIRDILRLDRAIAGQAPLSNMSATALLIASAAWRREESRGAHFRTDFPQKSEHAMHQRITLSEAYALANAIDEQDEYAAPIPGERVIN